MTAADDASLELIRRLRTSGQLQHAWTTQLWQADMGLHPAAAALLAELDRCGEVRPSELARRRMVDFSVVSRQITQLTSSGLVERRPAPEDGRAALVRVSERGAQELARWRRMHLELFRRALGEWDEHDVRVVAERLAAVNEDLRAVLAADEESRVATTRNQHGTE
ncbi:DNA-binding transcriptional regulator, MarR family [Amycolatopsis marina]|uniref:DNA-binding transcriptional regulator, MarR family n=1 Tax=Amycolatopsis marina TaxID=490629 RepID=A0A1I0VNW1_9PSEU|nr:MarR family winged helix-turn-helix transcriptional regulator [Amycolatopsis marina]SFA77316.1 DNA-binding transcriptional regulator, MarR family [Amycolatopsis marina]